jgi:hypothetical protein
MTTTTSTTRDEPVGSVSEGAPGRSAPPKSTSSTWGEDAVPVRDAAEQAEEREREARLRLVTGCRRL